MRKKNCLLLLATCVTLSLSANAQQSLTLWYNKPAASWNEALPIGNGRLAGMVFGQPDAEQIQLNEETVWAGGPHNNVNPDAAQVVPQLRKLILEKKFVEAQALANAKMFSKQNGMPYQTVGSLFLKFPGEGEVKDYRRDLDISKAIATVTFTRNGIHFKREVFASFTDQAIIVRLTADKPAAITCNLQLQTPMLIHRSWTANNKLILEGTGGSKSDINGVVKYQAQVKALTDGGKVTYADSTLSISKATTATIYIAMGTNFVNYHDVSGNAEAKTSAYLQKAIKVPYTQAISNHTAFYKRYFDRVKFNLGDAKTPNTPTDERITNFGKDHDLSLVSLYYQFGRYLLICASQPGNQAANLQGKWNDKIAPPWGGKYTININTEMNYWPAEETNLSELTEPLVHLVKDLSVTGKESASKMYGARGWMAHHNTDIWRISGQVDRAFYGIFPTGGAWLTQHLWEHYLYTGDKKFLQEIYPVLKGASTYFVDALQEEPEHHWLVVSPSMSPEHNFMSDKTVGAVSLTSGTTMDNQILFDLFNNTIAAAKALNTDAAFADTIKTKLNRLPPMQIGQWGQLQEWMEDWDIKGDQHRHISQLFGLYPGKQVSPFKHPELSEASRNMLNSRGDQSTGWSMGWKVNFWARLLDGNHAWKLITDQLHLVPANVQSGQGGGTYANLFDAHPPFQIDGNFGCTAGITEMLMQSYDGDIHLLPALPDEWKSGSISGLVTRGGFVLDMDWANGKITRLKITSKVGGNCRLRIANILKPSGSFKLTAANGGNPNPLFETADIKEPVIVDKSQLKGYPVNAGQLYDLQTQAGMSYILTGN